MELKYPEKWFQKPNIEKKTILEKNENLKMLLSFQLTTPQGKAQNSFYITTKDNKVKANHTIVHINETTKEICKGHTTEIAEYPIKNIKELTEETRIQSIAFAIKIEKEQNKLISLDKNSTIFILNCPTLTTKEILEKLKKDTTPEGEIPKQIIEQMLKPTIDDTTPIDNTTPPKLLSGLEILMKKATEQELIKKFGKKKLEILAKEMNYIGEIINNKNKH